jgi:hypothetical protein
MKGAICLRISLVLLYLADLAALPCQNTCKTAALAPRQKKQACKDRGSTGSTCCGYIHAEYMHVASSSTGSVQQHAT